MKYTINQELAIKQQGTSVLVSASAGSGKTGVLKSRVIEMIKNGTNIDELIILTFTNAAAKEMKSRIISELINLGLNEQLLKADNAIISTFDAFTLRLVKEYHYLLDLDQSITITDAIIIKKQKQDIIEATLKEYHKKKNPDFIKFYKMYFSKHDQWLYQNIYNLGESLRKIPHYESFIENYFENFFDNEYINQRINEYLESLRQKISTEYQDFLDEYFLDITLFEDSMITYLEETKNIVEGLINTIDCNRFITRIIYADFPRKPANKEVEKPEIIDTIKDIAKELKSLYITDKSSMHKSYLDTLFQSKILLEITKEYLHKYKINQKQKNLYSYEDIMFFAIRLLEEQQNIKNKLKTKIKEILVDEYQDTNDLQDYFISLISNNNIFMVGDVKQSIYRFRDANPKNFMRIYHEYQNKNLGKAIFLQENFRTNQYLLDFINQIFKKIMTEEIGGVNYSGQQLLISGYDKDYQLHDKDCFDILTYDFDKIKEHYPDLTKTEIETHIVARKINKLIESNELLFDLRINDFRPINYQDITILIDRKSDFLDISRIISLYNIPIDIYSDEEFVTSDEIQFVFSMLLLIESLDNLDYFNKYFKTRFYAVARSFVYQICDEKIIDLLVYNQLSSIEDTKVIADNETFSNLLSDLRYLHELSKQVPISILVEKLYQRTNIYHYIAFLDNPKQKENKLDFFVNRVASFKDFGFSDLIKYLETIIEDNSFDIEYTDSIKDINAVKLMSIHKSKGLQFGIVFLMGLYKQFNNPESKELFVFDKNFGILTKSYLQGFYPNFMQKYYFESNNKEDLSEKLRLLYVALTRAINRVIVTVQYKEQGITKKSFKCYQDLIYQTIDIKNYQPIDFVIEDIFSQNKVLEISDELIVFEKLAFTKLQTKEISYSKKIQDIIDDDLINLLEKGDNYHQAISQIDWLDFENSIKHLPETLRDTMKLFFASEVFEELSNPMFFPEYEFYEKKGDYLKRGIIDLLIISDNSVSVIDFKLRNIDDYAYVEQLLGYYEYLESKVNKKIDLFLYSLFEMRLKRINL